MDDLAREIIETVESFRNRAPQELHAPSGRMVAKLFFERGATILIPDPTTEQPALKFEKEHGLTGIGYPYRLIEGLDIEILESYFRLLRWSDQWNQQRLSKLTEVWHALAERNPVLSQLKFDHQSSAVLLDVLMGITSGFHVRDIQHFINTSKSSHATGVESTAGYRNLVQEYYMQGLGKKEPVKSLTIGWNASPETLKIIHQQLIKPQPAAAATRRNFNFIIE